MSTSEQQWSLTPRFPVVSVRTTLPRALLITEMVLLLGVSLGRSAIYSIVSLIEKLTRPEPLNQQTTSMNTSTVPDRPWLDLTYQVLDIALPLVPALLALHLLSTTFVGARRMIGFDLARPGRDMLLGLGVAAGIGIPGLGLYLAAKAAGLNTTVAAANLSEHFWTVPVLIGLAAMNGILEEVIMLGWWFVRARQVGMPWLWVIISSAVIRASYHLYQGFGGFIGNLIMGLIFGLIFLKCRRVMPLVIAHVLLDIAAFVGYTLVSPYVSWL